MQMRGWVLGWVLSAVSAQAAPPEVPLSVAFPGLSFSGVPEARRAVLNEHLVNELTRASITVLEPGELSQILSVERAGALQGCEEGATSCFADAAELGVDGVVVGEILRLEDGAYAVRVRALSRRKENRTASFATRVAEEDQLLLALTTAAAAILPAVKERWTEEIAAAARGALPLPAEPPEPAPAAPPVASLPPAVAPAPATHPLRRWSWAPAAAAVAAGIGGGLMLSSAHSHFGDLRAANAESPIQDTYAQQLVRDGKREEALGAALLGAGGLALAGAAVMYLLPGAAEAEVEGASFLVLPGAAAARFTWSFP